MAVQNVGGTNFFTGTSPVLVALTNPAGEGFLVIGSSPSVTTGYAVGALLSDPVAGILYINTGTSTTATWTRVGSQ